MPRRSGSISFAGLVAWPQSFAERLDDVIGGNGKVRCAAAEHTQDGCKHASHRGNFAAVPIPRGRQCVVVPEQLVCAVDQMNFQSRPLTSTLAGYLETFWCSTSPSFSAGSRA